MRVDELPELPGYLTVATVSKMFGITKESVFYKIFEQRAFQHVYRVGNGDKSQRPLVLLLESEVRKVLQSEKDAKNNWRPPLKDRTYQWNQRIKAWADETSWTQTSINHSGRPPLKLIAAYLEAHPDDPRPE